MSSSYHPETDGSSERFNKTVVQSLRFHVARNQTGWARALPLVRFNYMNTVNASTGFTPFQLHLGRSPRIIPPLVSPPKGSPLVVDLDAKAAADLLSNIETDVMEAQDNMLLAKTDQAYHANKGRSPENVYKVGDRVLLSTFHRRREFMQRGDHRVAKFMVRYDGPFRVVQAWPDSSAYTLDLPDGLHIFPTFHASLLRPFIANNDDLFPSRAHEEPGPVVTPDGSHEHVVERVIDRRRRGRGWQYLVTWKGYGPDHNQWMPGREIDDLAALDTYLAENGLQV